jgi:hypothetical protein
MSDASKQNPRIGIVWMDDIQDWVICGYDPYRGVWFVIEGRRGDDLGPGRLNDIVEAAWTEPQQ